MQVAIIGGKLQGTEAAYLAGKAGFHTLLIDQNPDVPARGLCEAFAPWDVTKKEAPLVQALRQADFVLPAMENDAVLHAIREMAEGGGMNVAFDFSAYAVTASKIQSDRLIRDNRIPAPAYFPGCRGMCIAKPSSGSGSEGVVKLPAEEVPAFLAAKQDPDNWIVEEFLTGPSYSLEVIGTPGHYRTYTVTQIHMDPVYDCNRVTAPCPVTALQEQSFERIAKELAELVRLHGIMDVEVIDDHGVLKVLEIDARIPSQTPAVVWHVSGINLLSELAALATGRPLQAGPARKPPRYCSYEHFLVQGEQIIPAGEHMMATAGLLRCRENFLGADEVISDFQPGMPCWRGIFINAAPTPEALEQKRAVMKEQLKQLSLSNSSDTD